MVHWVVLFGIPESDFILTIELLLQFKNTYWIVNGLSLENGNSLSHTHACNTFRVEKLYVLNTTHIFIDFHRI